MATIRQFARYINIISLNSIPPFSYLVLKNKMSKNPSKGLFKITLTSKAKNLEILMKKEYRDHPETFIEMFIGEPYLKNLPDSIREKNKPIVIDIGAHIGLFSLYAYAELISPHIYAYEPDPGNFRMLKRNIAINNLSDTIKPFNVAVGDNGILRFFSSSISSMSAAREVRNLGMHAGTGKYINVRSISITKILNKFKHIDILKMDCEGSEWKIIEEMSTKRLNISYICMEYHEFSGRKKEYIGRTLAKKGYKIHLRDKDNDKSGGILIAVKKQG